MYRRRNSRLLAFIAGVAFVASACASPPTREMGQAQGAIDAARAAGADRYAADEYNGAVDALKQAQDAVEQRDYRLALNHALDSRERAQAAAKHAVTEQAVLRSSAERRLGEVTAVLAQGNQRLSAAEAAHVPRRSLTAPRTAIASADTSLQKAGTAIKDGDYHAAQKDLDESAAQLKQAISQLDALNAGRGSAGRGARPRR